MQTDAIEILHQEFSQRKRRNGSYSIRAFARDLNISAGALSQVMSRSRPLGARTARRIVDRLALSSGEAALMLKNRTGKPNLKASKVQIKELDLDAFDAIADWHHYAILSLVSTPSFQNNHNWIATRLGIHIVEARSALERLIRLGMLERRGGRIVRRTPPLTTSQDTPSMAIRRHHRQRLDLAVTALESLSPEERDITGITVVFDRQRMAEAKQWLRAFRRKFMSKAEQKSGDDVFFLNLQFFPISKKGD